MGRRTRPVMAFGARRLRAVPNRSSRWRSLAAADLPGGQLRKSGRVCASLLLSPRLPAAPIQIRPVELAAAAAKRGGGMRGRRRAAGCPSNLGAGCQFARMFRSPACRRHSHSGHWSKWIRASSKVTPSLIIHTTGESGHRFVSARKRHTRVAGERWSASDGTGRHRPAASHEIKLQVCFAPPPPPPSPRPPS